MTPIDLLMFRFLLASGGCLVAGLGVWGLTALCRRHLPGFSAQRSLWLLSQITVLATFLVILLPHSERLRLVPPIDLPDTGTTRALAASAPATPATTTAIPTPADVPAADVAPRSWLAYGAQAWLLAYLLGLAYSTLRLLQARRLLNDLVASGSRVQPLDRHDGFNGAAPTPRAPAPAVIEVDLPISPMLFGLFQPRLLLPRHLRQFDPAQQQMIVEHELTHLRRRDLHWMSAGLLLQTLLWFNPFMWLLRAQLAWAQELGCDRDVLRGRPPAQRKAYAAALVAQLRLQHRPTTTALAFGGVSASTVAARIALIRDAAAAPASLWARGAAIGGLAGIVAGSLALQPAFAWRIDAVPADVQLEPEMPLPAGDAAAASASASASAPASASASAPVSTPASASVSCTELADAASGRRLVHEGQCDQRITPASTFNIAVSLMGYDSGILSDEHTPKLPFKVGYVSWNKDWRKATDPTSWIENSVVWYAQQVTARLGAERFGHYVQSFKYGNADVSGDPGKDNGLALSWIGSSLKISPVEQVDFLRRLVNRQLPLAPKAYDMTSAIMISETLENGWQIRGKTGTAAAVLADGRDDARHQYGWYVGWATKGQRTIVFARMKLDRRQAGSAGKRVKDAFLRDLTTRLDTL